MKKNSLVPILQGVWLFERCNRSELALIASVATEIDVPAGKILAREGDVGREFFVLLAGEAQATRQRNTDREARRRQLLRRDGVAGTATTRGHGYDL